MAQHGYLHDSYDRDDFGRGDDDRERSSRERDQEAGWRSRDREEESRWRGPDRDSNHGDRSRSSVFGGWRDHDRQSSDRNRESDRGLFERTKDETSEWFGGEHGDRDHDRYSGQRNQWQDRSQGQYGRGRQESSAFSSTGQSSQRYSAHPDDHYRSWRDKQMQALDRDYQDYCREREQQFHTDFDTWRQNRQSQSQEHGQSSMSQRQAGDPPNESLELDQVANRGGDVANATSSPMGAATMGTNNSENDASAPSATGRGKR